MIRPDVADLWLASTTAELWPLLIPQFGRSEPNSFDAQAVFRRVHDTDRDGAALTARLLLSHVRWSRVTGELVRALTGSGILDDADVDRMAVELLDGDRWLVPVTAVQLELLGGTAVDDGGRPVELEPDEEVALDRTIEPPLRRWAAHRAVARGLVPVSELWGMATGELRARHRALLLTGLLEAADHIDRETADALIAHAQAWPHKTVRDTAARLAAAREAARNPTPPEPLDTLW